MDEVKKEEGVWSGKIPVSGKCESSKGGRGLWVFILFIYFIYLSKRMVPVYIIITAHF